MRRAPTILLLLAVVAACATPKGWDEMTPDEQKAHLAFQAARVEAYVDFAKLNADKFVESGQWDKAHVDLAYQAQCFLDEDANTVGEDKPGEGES